MVPEKSPSSMSSRAIAVLRRCDYWPNKGAFRPHFPILQDHYQRQPDRIDLLTDQDDDSRPWPPKSAAVSSAWKWMPGRGSAGARPPARAGVTAI